MSHQSKEEENEENKIINEPDPNYIGGHDSRGYREGFGIFINNGMNDGESVGLNYGGYLITDSHEVLTHCLRNLLIKILE